MRRLIPAEGWPTAALMAALVYSTLHTIDAAGWGERVALAPRLALIGAGVGLLAAKTPLRAVWALPLALLIGLESVLLAQAVASPGTTWAERLGFTSDALWGWYRAALRSGAEHDPLVLASVIGAVGYVLGLCSSWLVFRLQSGWLAVVINAAAGLIHLSYATVDSVPPFLVSIFLGVLMVASLELHLRRSLWQSIGVPVQATSTGWTLGAAAGLAGLALVGAAQLPAGEINAELAARYQAVTAPWREFQKSIDKLVGGGKGQARPGGGLTFSQSLTPREDFELGSQPVLKVASPLRHYWRTTTYDRYDGSSISVSPTAERRYEADQPLPADPDGLRLRSAIEQRVTILATNASAVFAADAPQSFSLPILIDERQVGWDQASLRLSTPLHRGASYSVISAVPQAGRRELAEAPTTYPEWSERYLELPGALPPRVGELATSVSAAARNPLERALAVEAHLRSLTYSTRTVAPPADRDWVDFLLFDSKLGYCDSFATAMAVMLRTQGIPARVASGFASGVFDEQEKVWIVRESEAHSWSEAYFPGFGWITFEPSASRPTPERPESVQSPRTASSSSSGGGGRPDGLEELADDFGGLGATGIQGPVEPTTMGVGLGALAVLALVVGAGLGGLALMWEGGLTGEPVARRRYGQLRRWLDWGRWDVPGSATPYEVAEQLSDRLREQARPIRQLVDRHVQATYSTRRWADADDQAESAWQQIRGPLITASLARLLAPRNARPARRRKVPRATNGA